MRRKRRRVWVLMAGLAACLAITAGADEAPHPMRTEQPIVYATPIDDMVILEFKLYDNKTWCRLYLKKSTWEAVRTNGGKLPANADPGQLHCERR